MRRALLMTTAVWLAAGMTGAIAQDDAPVVERIVVTAQKREQDLQKVPISVKAIDDEEIDTVLIDGLEDISQLVPSLSIGSLARGNAQVQIRGLGTNVGNVGTVAIYNDGVISSSRIQSSGSFSEQDSVIYDVERVEVLRGPQGTLYGEGSFGGVINIISKRPDASQVQASLSGTWFDTEHGSSDNREIQGMVNLPLIEDVLAVRAVGYHFDRDGYIDAVNVLPVFFALPPVLVAEDANTENITGGRVLVSLTPSEGFEAVAIYKREKAELGISSYDSPNLIALANLLGGTNFDPQYTQALFDSAFGNESLVEEGILEVNVDLPFGRLTSITGVGFTDSENTAATFEAEAWSEEARLSSDNDGPFNWIFGAYYRDAERFIDLTGVSPVAEDALTQWAVFGQAYWEFIPTWTLTAGLRYEEQEIDVTDLLNGLPTVSQKFDSVVPKVAVDWQADDDTLFYVSIAKGFRAGGANVDLSLGTDPTFVGPFKPDEIWNYEVGVKAGLLDNMVTVNTAVFYIDWSDIQIDKAYQVLLPSPGVGFIVVNGEEAHSFGIEADILITPDEWTDIVIGGSLIEPEFDGGFIIDDPFIPPVAIDGNRLPSSPEYLFNASIERRFDIDVDLEAFIRADYSLRGSSFGDVPNQAPPGGTFESGESHNVNLRAGFRENNWELQAFVTNLTDEYSSTFTFFDGGFGDVHSIARPRTIGLNLKLRFSEDEQ
jgi:iron complex outermembrane receptor protein